MGVRGLQTFISKEVPNGTQEINFIDEIIDRQCNVPDQPIVLVFVFKDLLYNMSTNFTENELICGPSHLKIHKIFKQFLQFLRQHDVNMVFFTDGHSKDMGFDCWALRQSQQYTDLLRIIDGIDATHEMNCDLLTDQLLTKLDFCPGAKTPTFDLLKLCQDYGTLKMSTNQYYVVDIVNYANKHNALAIIGNNSDFIMFEGKWTIWSCRDIKLIDPNWNTVQYNKSAVKKYLGLNQFQMSLMATLAGNDFISFDEMKKYFYKLSVLGYNNRSRFLQIAKYVKSVTVDWSGNESLCKLSCYLFDSNDLKYVKRIKESLAYYNMTSNMTMRQTKKCTSLMNFRTFSNTYHQILMEIPIRIQLPPFFDLRRKDFLTYYDIQLPLLKRQIGLVRKMHGKNLDYKQVVSVKLSHFEPMRHISVTPEYPEELTDDLDALTFKSKDEPNDTRFRVLKWIIFGKNYVFPKWFILENIPKNYMVVLFTLMYLLKLKQINLEEANAILLTTYLIHNSTCCYENNISISELNASSRSIIVSHLYMNIHNLIVKSFYFVGLSEYADTLVFDGVYFINIFNELIKDNDNKYKHLLARISYLRYFLILVKDNNTKN